MINLKTEHSDINEDFKRIATELMNEWVLKIQNATYRITELEFYIRSSDHPDNYTHGHELQKKSGSWYFHGSGIDITFGSDNSYGGILIRALQRMEKPGNFTYGPINVVTELFSNLQDVYNSSLSFGLIEARNLPFEKPLAAPRVGLTKEKNPEMYDKYYRFLILPREKHGEKEKIAEAMKLQGYSETEIKSIWK